MGPVEFAHFLQPVDANAVAQRQRHPGKHPQQETKHPQHGASLQQTAFFPPDERIGPAPAGNVTARTYLPGGAVSRPARGYRLSYQRQAERHGCRRGPPLRGGWSRQKNRHRGGGGGQSEEPPRSGGPQKNRHGVAGHFRRKALPRRESDEAIAGRDGVAAGLDGVGAGPEGWEEARGQPRSDEAAGGRPGGGAANWVDFPGFRADVTVNVEGKAAKGTMEVTKKGKVHLKLQGEHQPWGRACCRPSSAIAWTTPRR